MKVHLKLSFLVVLFALISFSCENNQTNVEPQPIIEESEITILSEKEFEELLKTQLIIGLNISQEEWENSLSQKTGPLEGEYWKLISERKIPWGNGCGIERQIEVWINVGLDNNISNDIQIDGMTTVTPVDC